MIEKSKLNKFLTENNFFRGVAVGILLVFIILLSPVDFLVINKLQ